MALNKENRIAAIQDTPVEGSPLWRHDLEIKYLQKEVLGVSVVARGANRIIDVLGLPTSLEYKRSLERKKSVIATADHLWNMAHAFSHLFNEDLFAVNPALSQVVTATATIEHHQLSGDSEILQAVEEQLMYFDSSLRAKLLSAPDTKFLEEVLDRENPLNKPLTEDEKTLFAIAAIVGFFPFPEHIISELPPGVLRAVFNRNNRHSNAEVGIISNTMYAPLDELVKKFGHVIAERRKHFHPLNRYVPERKAIIKQYHQAQFAHDRRN